MFTKKPVRIVDGIFDFIGDQNDDYIDSYEELAKDRAGSVSIESSVLGNIMEVLSAAGPFGLGSVLDVGCGNGYVLECTCAKEKVALDISLERLRYFDGSCIRVRANSECMPFETDFFNSVICFDLLEHVKDPFKVVLEINRLLKVGGLLFFACPWEQDLSVYDDPEYRSEFKQYKYKHLRSISQREVDVYFPNFRVVNTTTIVVAMWNMAIKPYPIKFMHLVMEYPVNGYTLDVPTPKTSPWKLNTDTKI